MREPCPAHESSTDAHADPREDLRRGPHETIEWPLPARDFLLMEREHAFSLHVGFNIALHFDLEGRLRRAFIGGTQYLRGLDGKVLCKTRRRAPAGGRGEVPGDSGAEERRPRDTGELYAITHESVTAALDVLNSGEAAAGIPRPRLERARTLLERAAQWGPRRLAAEAQRFAGVYAPLGVLPPDCYRTLILQATSGCSYNRCAFCTLYRSVPFRTRTPAEFREHILAVRRFLGRALPLRRGVFLGEANALEVPASDLVEMLAAIRELVPEVAAGRDGPRVHAFSDVFPRRPRGERGESDGDLRRLAELGLRRVYLGVESGSDTVLRSLRKPASRSRVIERVAALRRAGISVGLIFLVGAGGREHAREHVEETASLVAALRPGRDDIVFLSPLTWPTPGAALAGGTPAGDPRQLTGEELEREERELRARLRAAGARVGRYDISTFVYL